MLLIDNKWDVPIQLYHAQWSCIIYVHCSSSGPSPASITCQIVISHWGCWAAIRLLHYETLCELLRWQTCKLCPQDIKMSQNGINTLTFSCASDRLHPMCWAASCRTETVKQFRLLSENTGDNAINHNGLCTATFFGCHKSVVDSGPQMLNFTNHGCRSTPVWMAIQTINYTFLHPPLSIHHQWTNPAAATPNINYLFLSWSYRWSCCSKR